MESLTFSGDAFSEYYLTHLLWDETRLQPFLGLDSVQASYRLAAGIINRGQQALKGPHLSRSTGTLLLAPLAEILGWTFGDEETVETTEGTRRCRFSPDDCGPQPGPGASPGPGCAL